MADFGFWTKLRYLFSRPNTFFEKVKPEKGIKNSSIILIIFCAALFLISETIFTFYASRQGVTFYNLVQIIMAGLGSNLIFLLFLIILLLMLSGLIHLIIMMAFKSKGEYKDSYNVCAYSIIASSVLVALLYGIYFIVISKFLSPLQFMQYQFLPYLVMIAYFVYMLTIGVSKTYELSKGKAAFVCIFAVLLAVPASLFLRFISNVFLRI